MTYRYVIACMSLQLVILIGTPGLNLESVNAADQKMQSIKIEYSEFKRFPLTNNTNGIDGILILMRDSRAMNVNGWTEKNDIFFNALLCIIDRNNRVIETCQLERPIANLDITQLISGKLASYILTVDYSIGMGSYAGLGTEFFNVSKGRIKWINAIDRKTNKPDRIRVSSTLKTGWKLVPSGRNFDILQVLCRPSFTGKENNTFTVTYERYHNNGQEWIKYARSEVGWWEDENGFPEESLFPSVK